MEVVAKLGRARFGSPIHAKKPAEGIAPVCGTFFEVRVFGGSATASMRRPCILRRHACGVTKSPCAVVTITTAPPPRHMPHQRIPQPSHHGTPRTNASNGLLHHMASAAPMHRAGLRARWATHASPLRWLGARRNQGRMGSGCDRWRLWRGVADGAWRPGVARWAKRAKAWSSLRSIWLMVEAEKLQAVEVLSDGFDFARGNSLERCSLSQRPNQRLLASAVPWHP